MSAPKGHKRSTSRRDVGVWRWKFIHRQAVEFSPEPGVATELLHQIGHDENSRSSNASNTRQRHDTPERHLFTMRTARTTRRDTRGAASTFSRAIATLDQNRATRGTCTPQRRRCRQRAPSAVPLPPRSRPSSDEPHDCVARPRLNPNTAFRLRDHNRWPRNDREPETRRRERTCRTSKARTRSPLHGRDRRSADAW